MTDTTTITVRAPIARVLGHRPVSTRLLASVSILLCLPALGGCDDGASMLGAPGEPSADTSPATPPTVPDRAMPESAIPNPAAPGPGASAATAPDAPWTVPQGWTLDPEPRAMRLATFLAAGGDTDTEIAVSRFGGGVGGELANINRWRGQVGLGPIDGATLETEITRFGDAGAPGYSARARGELVHLLAAGIYDPANDRTWFVRVIGAPDAVDAVEADVNEFARSISRTLAGD